MKFKRSLIAAVLLIALCALLSAPFSANAYTVEQQWARFSATCGETLAEGQMAALKDADGYAYKADANDAALRPAVGIVGKGCSSGGSAEIVVFGIVSGWTNLSEGAGAYLSETAGAVTQSSPTYSQQVN